MLAKRRSIKIKEEEVQRTPLLVPSFSSKGFPDVANMIAFCSELIDEASLFSSYDIYYKKIQPPFEFPSLIFLDSGGYEASRDAELSDFGDKEHSPKPWDQAKHEEILASWTSASPTIFISYDHPKERLPLKKQIERAAAMAPDKIGLGREILLKPETQAQTLIQVGEVIKHVHSLSQFDILGVTEKEIGNSILDRMKNIALIRRALDKANIDIPIHVFGSLDTVTTPLYFLAGADIFDGLTWLRFAFSKGQTIYKHNYGALELGLETKTHMVDGRVWNSNYYYLKDLQLEMRRFLGGSNFSAFKHHSELFQMAYDSTIEAIGG